MGHDSDQDDLQQDVGQGSSHDYSENSEGSDDDVGDGDYDSHAQMDDIDAGNDGFAATFAAGARTVAEIQMAESERHIVNLNVQAAWKHVSRTRLDDEGARKLCEARAASALFATLWDMANGDKVLDPPRDTVYTACVLLPMVARSSRYQLSMVALSVHTMLLWLMCVNLQGLLIMSLHRNFNIVTVLAGTPHVCTYGQSVGADPPAPRGPSGLTYKPDISNIEPDPALYMIRNTLTEVLKHINVTNPAIGPVEFGMQHATTRFVCIAVLIIGVFSEIGRVRTMLLLLWKIPTLRKPIQEDDYRKALWIGLRPQADVCSGEAGTRGKQTAINAALENVVFRVNGMPLSFKVLWAWPVTITNVIVRCFVLLGGIILLMDTGGIMELLLNALAITFILDIDVLVFRTFGRKRTKDIMDRMLPFDVSVAAHRESNFRVIRRTEENWTALQACKRVLHLCRPAFICVILVVVSHFFYLITQCELERWPLNFSSWFEQDYYDYTGVRWFGGWEFVFGSWRSRHVKSGLIDDATCVPSRVGEDGSPVEPQGCSLPRPWPYWSGGS